MQVVLIRYSSGQRHLRLVEDDDDDDDFDIDDIDFYLHIAEDNDIHSRQRLGR